MLPGRTAGAHGAELVRETHHAGGRDGGDGHRLGLAAAPECQVRACVYVADERVEKEIVLLGE